LYTYSQTHELNWFEMSALNVPQEEEEEEEEIGGEGG
jgi:hypothetical protein